MSLLAHQFVAFPQERSSIIETDCVQYLVANGFNVPKENRSSLLWLGSSCKPLATRSHFARYSSFDLSEYYPDFKFVFCTKRSVWNPTPSSAKFIEPLTHGLKHLQWMADVSDTHTENEVLANQHLLPKDMEKSEFLCFGRARVAPLLQIRNLVQALSEPFMKLNNGDFLILVRRILYEIGPVSIRNKTCPWTWKLDLCDNEWTEKLIDTLQTIHGRTYQNWQSRKVMLMIIEIVMYVKQFTDDESTSNCLKIVTLA
jgi:hypothetical protein